MIEKFKLPEPNECEPNDVRIARKLNDVIEAVNGIQDRWIDVTPGPRCERCGGLSQNGHHCVSPAGNAGAITVTYPNRHAQSPPIHQKEEQQEKEARRSPLDEALEYFETCARGMEKGMCYPLARAREAVFAAAQREYGKGEKV